MFERILVPLDGSTRAEAALPIAARVARATGSSVVLLQVTSPPMSDGIIYGYGSGQGATATISESVGEREEIEAAAYLTRIARSDLFEGIATTTEVDVGSPAPQILALAEQSSVNLIILCSHGRTGLTRWVLGSVAQRVIHHSHVPVLVLREGGSALTMTGRPLRAVVAVDGSPIAETALIPAAHLVAALSQHTQGVLHLLHVVKPYVSLSDEDAISHHDREEVEQAQVYLQRVRERLLAQTSDLNLQITWSATLAQDAAETIVTTAEKETESTGEKSCDVLAMATHGRGGIEHWVMGSVTERVLEATTLPMLVIRPSQGLHNT